MHTHQPDKCKESQRATTHKQHRSGLSSIPIDTAVGFGVLVGVGVLVATGVDVATGVLVATGVAVAV